MRRNLWPLCRQIFRGHITAFHPDYKMTSYDYTTAQQLLRAVNFGREAGLHSISMQAICPAR